MVAERGEDLRVAVLIPVYNNPVGLLTSLESLGNSSTPVTAFVVDDGSTAPLRLPEKMGRANITCIRLSTQSGISKALNVGLDAITRTGFPLVARLDAGDIVLPKRLHMQATFLEGHPGCGIVASDVLLVDMSGQPLFVHRVPLSQHIRKGLHVKNHLLHPAVMMRTAAICQVGQYDSALTVSEDYDLFLRIAACFEIASIPEVLTICELNPGGITATNRRRQQRERLRLQLRYFNYRLWQSYAGLLRTAAALFAPARLAVMYKKTSHSGRSRKYFIASGSASVCR